MSREWYRRCGIVLSGGTGSRLGGKVPKQYLPVAGRTVIEHTLYAVRNWAAMDALLIAAREEWREYLEPVVRKAFPGEKVRFLGFSPVGEERQETVLFALRELTEVLAEDAIVMLHDAVRPLVSEELLMRCDEALLRGDGVMPYLPLKDTAYLSTDGQTITGSTDRDAIILGQTPEFYRYRPYLAANEALSREELCRVRGSSEPAVSAGMKIALVRGEERNFKLTTKEDLERFQRIREGRR